MKKAAAFVLGIAVLGLVAAPAWAAAHSEDDLQAIKKAVRENPCAQPGGKAKWFKILVVDDATHKAAVKVTVPLSLVELFLRCADNKHLRIKGKCDIDLEVVLNDLRTSGPRAKIELNEDGKTVKIWIE